MIKSIKISGIAYEIDERTRAYAIEKIGRLEKYIPRHARKTVSADIKLEKVNHSEGDNFVAEANLNLPGKTVNSKESAVDMLSAIDIIEGKLRNQLRDYKQKSVNHIAKRGIMSRFKRSFSREL